MLSAQTFSPSSAALTSYCKYNVILTSNFSTSSILLKSCSLQLVCFPHEMPCLPLWVVQTIVTIRDYMTWNGHFDNRTCSIDAKDVYCLFNNGSLCPGMVFQ